MARLKREDGATVEGDVIDAEYEVTEDDAKA